MNFGQLGHHVWIQELSMASRPAGGSNQEVIKFSFGSGCKSYSGFLSKVMLHLDKFWPQEIVYKDYIDENYQQRLHLFYNSNVVCLILHNNTVWETGSD